MIRKLQSKCRAKTKEKPKLIYHIKQTNVVAWKKITTHTSKDITTVSQEFKNPKSVRQKRIPRRIQAVSKQRKHIQINPKRKQKRSSSNEAKNLLIEYCEGRPVEATFSHESKHAQNHETTEKN
jgi:hypothetical protein